MPQMAPILWTPLFLTMVFFVLWTTTALYFYLSFNNPLSLWGAELKEQLSWSW